MTLFGIPSPQQYFRKQAGSFVTSCSRKTALGIGGVISLLLLVWALARWNAPVDEIYNTTFQDFHENLDLPPISDIPRLYVPKTKTKSDSKGETECREVLKKLFNRPFAKARPDYAFSSITGRKLEFDCFDLDMKLAVEFQGRQHYEHVPFFHKTPADFKLQQYRDKEKQDICTKLGITLIKVHYQCSDIEAYLRDELTKHNFADRFV